MRTISLRSAQVTPLTVEEFDSFTLMNEVKGQIENKNNNLAKFSTSALSQLYTSVARGRVGIGVCRTRIKCHRTVLRAHMEREYEDDIKKNNFWRVNDHHTVRNIGRNLPFARKREFLVSVITKDSDENTTIVIVLPCLASSKPKNRTSDPSAIQGSVFQMYVLKSVGVHHCDTTLEFFVKIDMVLPISSKAAKVFLPKLMSSATRWQEKFQHLVRLEKLTEEDGRNMGLMLAFRKKGEGARDRLGGFMKQNVGLQQLGAKVSEPRASEAS